MLIKRHHRNPYKGISTTVSNRKGAALITVGLSVTALFSVMALSIDLGMLYVARGEAQSSADAAALAGGAALIERPHDPDYARRVAAEYVGKNKVLGESATLYPEDIQVVLGVDTFVSVSVRRAGERNNPVETMFAKVFGIDAVDLGAYASASPMPTGSATCLKPFLVPDAWDDANGNGSYDSGEFYEPGETGYGSEWRNDGYAKDLGRPITLYPGTPDATIVSGWYFLFRPPGSSGANDVRTMIGNATCSKDVASVGTGLEVDNEPGRKKGPVSQGVQDLIATDPDAYWDATSNTVIGSIYGENWRASPRVVTFPLFDPTQSVQPGMRPIKIVNFATVFLESSNSGKVTGIFLPVLGVGQSEDCRASNTCSPFAKYVALTQ